MQKSVYENIKKNANKFGFKSATAIIMDINTGEILVNADYVNKNINKIPDYGLYRSISGLFTPGSTVKPFFALAALEEDIISPQETVYSSGKLLLENKYDPENPSVFLDWKAHGLVNLREAIASSSNIYFYHIGGGYKNRKGLGIDKLFRYATLFGFGIPTNTDIAKFKNLKNLRLPKQLLPGLFEAVLLKSYTARLQYCMYLLLSKNH